MRYPTNKSYAVIMASVTVLVAVVLHLIVTDSNMFVVNRSLHFVQVLVHEFGHAFATWITGGRVMALVVGSDGGGYVQSAGGWWTLILPAGYLGSALIGSVVFYFNNRYQWGAVVAFGVGIVMGLFALTYAQPDQATGTQLTVIVAVVLSVVVFLVSKYLPWHIGVGLINVLSAYVALDAINGLRALEQLSRQDHHNDAVQFSQLYPFLNGNQWATIWLVIAVAIFGLAVYRGVVRPLWHPKPDR